MNSCFGNQTMHMQTHTDTHTLVPYISVRNLFPGQMMIYGRLLYFPPFSCSILGEYIPTMCFCLAWHIPSKLSVFHVLVKGPLLRNRSKKKKRKRKSKPNSYLPWVAPGLFNCTPHSFPALSLSFSWKIALFIISHPVFTGFHKDVFKYKDIFSM